MGIEAAEDFLLVHAANWEAVFSNFDIGMAKALDFVQGNDVRAVDAEKVLFWQAGFYFADRQEGDDGLLSGYQADVVFDAFDVTDGGEQDADKVSVGLDVDEGLG